jgi:dihydropteroate synthase
VIAELARRFGADGPSICIDTRSAPVAQAALDAGATVVNDISALQHDTEMASLVAARGAGIVLMHMKGTPADMQIEPRYEDVMKQIIVFLAARVTDAVKAGVSRERIIIDPGIGFGKTTAHNLEILRRLGELRALGQPVMVGPSRKRFIGEILGIENPRERLHGTLAVVASCVLADVECVRVHDVAACWHVATICAAVRRYNGNSE